MTLACQKRCFLCGFKSLKHKAVFAGLRPLQLVTTIVFQSKKLPVVMVEAAGKGSLASLSTRRLLFMSPLRAKVHHSFFLN